VTADVFETSTRAHALASHGLFGSVANVPVHFTARRHWRLGRDGGKSWLGRDSPCSLPCHSMGCAEVSVATMICTKGRTSGPMRVRRSIYPRMSKPDVSLARQRSWGGNKPLGIRLLFTGKRIPEHSQPYEALYVWSFLGTAPERFENA
jgi:hypothetical protein